MIRLKSIINEDLFGSSLKMKPHEALMVKSVVSFMMDKYGFNAKIIVKKKEKAGMIGDISLNSNSVSFRLAFVCLEHRQVLLCLPLPFRSLLAR